LQRGKLHVRRTIWHGVTGLPKGGRERTVDLPGSAVDALKGHRHLRGPYVFCQEDDQPLTDGLMKLPLQRGLRRAGISREQGRIGWHDLRHTYGSHLAMRGVPLKVIQELMGHATIEMTMRYAHLAPETRERAVQQLDRPVPQLHAALARDAGGVESTGGAVPLGLVGACCEGPSPWPPGRRSCLPRAPVGLPRP